MSDITIGKKTVEKWCKYLLDGYGNQFSILFSETEHTENCVDIINVLTRSFSKLYFGIEYCYKTTCPCSPFYDLNWIRSQKGFSDTINFLKQDNKGLYLYLENVFEFFDENSN